jgi:hypothetical protein
MPDNNITSYMVNHSLVDMYVYDGLNCTGARLVVYGREYGGVPAGWNDKLSSVRPRLGIETVPPADAARLQNGGFLK